MYSLKFAHLVKEKLPDAACYEFYIDMRAFGKGYEEFFERIKDEGDVHRPRPVGDGDRARRPDGRQGRGHPQRQRRWSSRSTWSCSPSGSSRRSARTSWRACSASRAMTTAGSPSSTTTATRPDTERGGIYVAGVCQGPKDIPDTVAQASAVAARVLEGAIDRDAGSQSLGEPELSPTSRLAPRASSRRPRRWRWRSGSIPS